MAKRLVYWLTEDVTPLHKDRAAALARRGYQVEFCSSLSELRRVFAARRVSIIVVGDEGTLSTVESYVMTMANAPEISGVRLILSLSQPNPDLVQLAASHGFRDAIALDWEHNHWLQRFLFSTAGASGGFVTPLPQMTLNTVAAITIPARVVWINYDNMWIETRVTPPAGAQIKLAGNIVSSLGMRAMTVTVEECRKSNLRYRFSDALIVRWGVASSLANKQRILIDHLKSTSIGRTCKVFIAVQTPTLRTTVIDHLRDPRFEVSAALQKQSIVNEPKFFSPNVIFIEDKLTSGEEFGRFEQMMQNTEEPAIVIVLGNGANMDELRRVAPKHKCAMLTRVPANLAEVVFSKYLKAIRPLADQEDNIQIGPQSDFSFAELSFSGRMTRVHPSSAQLALSVPLGNFGMCRIDSPLFKRTVGRSVCAKITDTYSDNRRAASGFPHLVEVSLADVFARDREKLAVTMCDMMTQRLLAKAPLPDRDVHDLETMDQHLTQAPAAAVVEGKLLQLPLLDESPKASPRLPRKGVPRRNANVLEFVASGLRSKSFHSFVILVVVTIGAIWLMNWAAENLSFSHSGGNYSDQLKLFKRNP